MSLCVVLIQHLMKRTDNIEQKKGTWVSSRFVSVGETLTNMSVFAVPPRESDMSMVSLWLR